MAKKTIKRTKYQLEDNIKRVVFFRPGEGGGDGGGGIAEIPYATRAETDAGVLTDKALNPDVGAYAYDRFRYPGRHAAGKGTKVVSLQATSGVFTIDCLKSNVFEAVLTEADMVFANPLNPINGQTINIHVRQTVEGGRQATFGDAWTFTNRIDPTFTEDASATDLLSCQWDASAGKMRCSFLPNFGSGYVPPPDYTIGDFSFINLGGGNEVVIGRDPYFPEVTFRTIVAEGDIDVRTEGDTIVISYSAPVQTIETLNDLVDVDAPAPVVGDQLTFDGTNWVPASGRRWTVGATWTNGPNELIIPVNDVNSVISEKCAIVGWYLLSDGGTGSCEVDILRVPINEFPPLTSDSICGGNKPAISSAFMAEDAVLTDWSVDCEQGDLLQFQLNSVDTFTTVQIILILEKRT